MNTAVDSVLMQRSEERAVRRLQEVRYSPTTNPRWKALNKALGRKGEALNATEQRVLAAFEPLPLTSSCCGGRAISSALTYADALRKLPVREHCAIVKLLQLNHLTIEAGYSHELQGYVERIIRNSPAA